MFQLVHLAGIEEAVVLAPAMNDNMYAHPAVQRNIATLKGFGYQFIDPEAGDLACGRTGMGRLADLDKIVAAIEAAALARKIRDNAP